MENREERIVLGGLYINGNNQNDDDDDDDKEKAILTVFISACLVCILISSN